MVGNVLVVELRFSWDILVFMNLKIISWNVRGLNDSRKRLIVKNLLREWKCDVICLQEELNLLAWIDKWWGICGAALLWIGWL